MSDKKKNKRKTEQPASLVPRCKLLKRNVDLETAWSLLRRNFEPILVSNAPMTYDIFGECYAMVFELATYNEPAAAELYTRCKTLLSDSACKIILDSSDGPDEKLACLTRMTRIWKEWAMSTKYISNILAFINRKTVAALYDADHNCGAVDVDVYATKVFFENCDMQQIQASIIELLQLERTTGMDTSPMSPIVDTVRMIHDFDGITNIPRNILRNKIGNTATDQQNMVMQGLTLLVREAARRYYIYKAQSQIDIMEIERLYRTEENRMERCFGLDSRHKVSDIILDCLVVQREPIIVDEIRTAIISRHDHECAEIYRVIHSDYFRELYKESSDNIISSSICASIAELSKDISSDVIHGLIALQKRSTEILLIFSDAHSKDAALKTMVRIVNDIPNISVLLCGYYEELVKKHEDVKEQEDVVQIFRALCDKDIFVHYYSRSLARRLLMSRGVDCEFDAQFISKIKPIYQGSDCTKLEAMIQDMHMSKTLSDEFGSKWLDISVLTAGSWMDMNPRTDQSFQPSQMVLRGLKEFEVYYKARGNANRKLTFLHHLSRAEMLCRPSGAVISCTAYQAYILETCEKPQTRTELSLSLVLSPETVDRMLEPILKQRVLLEDSNGVRPNNELVIKKHKISVVPLKMAPSAQKKEDEEEVDEYRQLRLQAAAVRIMKSRKKLSHNELVEGVVKDASRWFKATMRQVKMAIEHLIQEEYILRSGDVNSVAAAAYEYVA